MTTIKHILSLEQVARRKGSGIEPADLNGTWRLERTWTRSGDEPSPGSNPILRSLGAQLQLTCHEQNWRISNQINVGALYLRFEGNAFLKGARPLLNFNFDTLSIMLNKVTLFQREIPSTTTHRSPFFALIAVGPDGTWLAARGRGGGLALWQKDDDARSIEHQKKDHK